ncbi:MAG: acetylxylan esterase [Kiritimatiellae bacterium]|nr:acetylxylan esterase [Kiritimatiellia bacterium]
MKRTLSALLFSSVALLASANEFDAVVCRGATRSPDPVGYAAGEPIVFELSFENAPDSLFDGSCRLDWKRQGDDGQTTTGSLAIENREPLEIATSLDRPGFVFVTADVVRAADGTPVLRDVLAQGAQEWEGLGRELHFALGAGVETGKIAPAIEEPEDFDEFWARQKARLAAVPVRAEEIPMDFGDGGFDFLRVKVDCAGPRPVFGVLAIPANAEPKSLKAVVEVHGYGVFRQGRPWSAQPGRMVFSINAHGVDPLCDDAAYAEFEDGIRTPKWTYAFSPHQNEYPEGCYFNGMALRVMRAFDYVRTRPEWNGADLEVEGGSQGGAQSLWAAGLVDGLTAARPEVPWMCDVNAPAAGRFCSPWRLGYAPGLAYYDAIFHARRAKCFVDVKRAGLGDDVCVPSGIAAMFNNLPEGCRRILWIQGARHGYVPPPPGQETELR